MKHIPYDWRAGAGLDSADFDRFRVGFERTVAHFLPFAVGPVTFLAVSADTGVFADKNDKFANPWADFIKQGDTAEQWRRPVIVPDKNLLFLPLWSGRRLIGVGAIEGVDPLVAPKLDEDWLLTQSRIISREFGLIKQLAIDPATGLLNGRHLLYELEVLLEESKIAVAGKNEAAHGNFTIFLLELYPMAKDVEKALRYVTRAGYFLQSCLGQTFPLHHLAAGVFGLIWRSIDSQEAAKAGEALLAWLKRENFPRVHVGFTTSSLQHVTNNNAAGDAPNAELLLDQAWYALRMAGRRGPYAVCSYASLNNSKTNQLEKVPVSLLAGLRHLWRDEENFALLLCRQDPEPTPQAAADEFSGRLLSLIEAEVPVLPVNDREVYVFLAGVDEQGGQAWVRAFKKKIRGLDGITLSVGIAVFPCYNYKKNDIPLNARKALLHTEFFGPDTITAFDGVSLNVSGDIYYNEGDLPRAIKEYRQGLVLDPANVNLLNSLGEAYARMSRPKTAIPLFEQALDIDPDNYMALYNHGLACLRQGADDSAVVDFEKALAALTTAANKEAAGDAPDNFSRLRLDFIVQLGRLYCRRGRYEEAVGLLAETIEAAGKTVRPQNHGLILRCLGEAYKGVGRNKEAMAALQTAVRSNPHDAAALSLLGEIYGLQNQGDDIALSLCRQAVDLDETQWDFWYRLGWIQFRLKNFEAAKEALTESLRLLRKNTAALYLLGEIYEKEGQTTKARRKYRRVLQIEAGHKGAVAALARLQKQPRRKRRIPKRR